MSISASSSPPIQSSSFESLKIFANEHPLDVGVVFESASCDSCAHRFRLDALVRYLDGTLDRTSPHHECPKCQTRISWVCDEVVAKQREIAQDSSASVVLFKYNKQTFCLAVENKDTRWWQRSATCTAQERMAEVLGMNVKSGMKILCKGKVLYPNLKISTSDLSIRLIDLSLNDLKNKKPSLVVMGTRAGEELRPQSQGIFVMWYGMMQWSIGLVLRFTQATFSTTFSMLLWPLQYLRILPQSRNGDNSTRRTEHRED
mmetsp:Transcript_27457/g.38646  ORF Transcript_27457/g.38646 Transcript_27457/m.38646 type:complete len:259 (+) Transcript_27457:159-935(+)